VYCVLTIISKTNENETSKTKNVIGPDFLKVSLICSRWKLSLTTKVPALQPGWLCYGATQPLQAAREEQSGAHVPMTQRLKRRDGGPQATVQHKRCQSGMTDMTDDRQTNGETNFPPMIVRYSQW